jgi:hypothetical protein
MHILINWPRDIGPEVHTFAAALDSAPSIVWDSLEADWRSAGVDRACVVLDVGDGPEIPDAAFERVTLTDSDGVPLYRSDRLARCAQELLEVVVGVHHEGDAAYAQGLVRGTADPEETLRGATAVLPLLIRKAQALPAGAGARQPNNPAPAVAPTGSGPGPDRNQTRTRAFRARVSSALDRRFKRIQWQVGVLEVSGSVIDLLAGDQRLDTRWLKPPNPGSYWADPCPALDSDGALWVFVEEFPFRVGNGHIVAVRCAADGIAEVRTVLADEHHRALPRVQRHQGRWLATVDTCQNPAPVFTFDEIGGPWRAVPGAFLPPYAVDPMLSHSGDGWSVILTNWTLDEGSACETWRSVGGPPFDWRREDAISYVDPVRGRGAGQLDSDQRMRAVQDCSWAYGLKTSLIGLDSGADGRPELLATLLPERLSGRCWERTHTLAWVPKPHPTGADDGSKYVILDAGWSKVDLAWPVLRKRELTHLRSCREATLALTARDQL